jgi:hypothetical protein
MDVLVIVQFDDINTMNNCYDRNNTNAYVTPLKFGSWRKKISARKQSQYDASDKRNSFRYEMTKYVTLLTINM